MKLFTKIAFAFLLPALALAESGSGSGGSVDTGGEYLALKFTKLGQEALSAMKKLSPEEAILSAAELQRMELALVQTRVNGLARNAAHDVYAKLQPHFVELVSKRRKALAAGGGWETLLVRQLTPPGVQVQRDEVPVADGALGRRRRAPPLR